MCRGTAILLRAVWDGEFTGVQEDGERDVERRRIKRTKAALRGRERVPSHIRAS